MEEPKKPACEILIRDDLIGRKKKKSKELKCSGCAMPAEQFCVNCEGRQRISTMCKKHLRGTPERPLCRDCFNMEQKAQERIAKAIEGMEGNIARVVEE